MNGDKIFLLVLFGVPVLVVMLRLYRARRGE